MSEFLFVAVFVAGPIIGWFAWVWGYIFGLWEI